VRVLPPSSKTNPPIPTKSKDDGWLKAAEEDLKSLRKRLTCLTILRIAEAEEQQEGVAGVRPADVEAASSAMIPNADEAPAHWPATTVGGAGADDVRSEAGVSERWDGVSQRWEDELSEAEPIDGADGIADVETDVERPPDGTAGEGEEGPGPPPETLLKEDETPKSVSDEALQAFLAGAGDDGFDDRSTDYGDDEARSPAPADEGSSACGDENESSWPGLSVSPDQFRRQRPSPPRDMPSLTLPPAAAPLLRVGGAPDDGEPEAPELPPYAPEGFTFAPMTPKKRNKGLEEGDGGSAELDGRRASIESARTTLPRPSSDSVRDFSPDGRPSSAFGDFSPEEEEDRRWSPRRWSAASAASSAMIANADEDHEAQKEKVGDVDDDEDADPPGTPAARPRSSIDAPTGTPPPRHERRFPHAPSSWTGGGGDVDATDAGLKRSLGSAFETAQSATAGTKQPRHGGSGLADRHFSGGFASGEEEEKADADVGKHAAVEVDIYGGEALAERLHAHRASADWSRWSRKCALQNLTPSRDAAASAGAEGFVELQADHVPEAAPVGADVTATVEEPAELEERNREGDIFGYASEAGVLLDGQGAEGPQREEQREAEGEAQVLADNDEEDEEAGPRGGGGALVVQETSYSSPPAHLPAAAAVEMDLAVVAADAGAVDEAGSGDAGELEADGYPAVADEGDLGVGLDVEAGSVNDTDSLDDVDDDEIAELLKIRKAAGAEQEEGVAGAGPADVEAATTGARAPEHEADRLHRGEPDAAGAEAEAAEAEEDIRFRDHAAAPPPGRGASLGRDEQMVPSETRGAQGHGHPQEQEARAANAAPEPLPDEDSHLPHGRQTVPLPPAAGGEDGNGSAAAEEVPAIAAAGGPGEDTTAAAEEEEEDATTTDATASASPHEEAGNDPPTADDKPCPRAPADDAESKPKAAGEGEHDDDGAAEIKKKKRRSRRPSLTIRTSGNGNGEREDDADALTELPASPPPLEVESPDSDWATQAPPDRSNRGSSATGGSSAPASSDEEAEPSGVVPPPAAPPSSTMPEEDVAGGIGNAGAAMGREEVPPEPPGDREEQPEAAAAPTQSGVPSRRSKGYVFTRRGILICIYPINYDDASARGGRKGGCDCGY